MISKLKWYFHRLTSMSFAEINYRLRQRMRIEIDRRSNIPTLDLQLKNIDSVACWSKFLHQKDYTFFFNILDLTALQQMFAQTFATNKTATLETAEQLLQHKINIFGEVLILDEQINWHCDPLTRKVWPNIFWANIDTRDGKTIGGVKWVWELNRHHHLVTLAKAYFLTDDERYATEVCHQLTDWIETNPPGFGVNWTSSLELALRLINWTWVLAFIRQFKALTPALFQTILQSVNSHAHHISRYLSAHSSANNHLIGEAAGLAVAGICFPWLSQAQRWRDTGLAIMTREIELQIYPDGVPAEQATHYLAFILDFNLVVWQLAHLNHIKVPQIWHQRLGAACDFIRHLMDTQNHVPAIGDSDDAWVIRLDDQPHANNFSSILATAAIILKRPDLKASTKMCDEKSFWLTGITGLSTYTALATHKTDIDSHCFEKGGYTVMRHLDRVITFDHGPLGYLSTAAHGHADALNLLISLNDTPLLIDPNTYAYQEGGVWRDYLRSTAAHNTILINQTDQSQIKGTFLWGQRATAKLLTWQPTPTYDLAVASHDGYKQFNIIHTRAILFYKPNWILVADYLQGQGIHTIEQLWHFPADVSLALLSNQANLTINTQPSPTIFWDNTQITPQIYHKQQNPIQGWLSSHYHHLEPAPVLSLKGQLEMPLRLITLFYLGKNQPTATLQQDKTKLLTLFQELIQETNKELL